MKPFAPDPSRIESGNNAILSIDPSSAVRRGKLRNSVAPKTESDGADCVPEATKTLPDSTTSKAAKTDKTTANLILAAGVPRKYVGRVYIKLAHHALPTDEDKAKAYIRRTLKNALIDIDRERRRMPDRVSFDPQSALWDAFACNQIRPDDVERKKTLRALIQTGIALLSPHQRSLVRAWVDRSDENNVSEIHEALQQTCGYGAYHCKNRAFASLTRIVSGLAAATGNSDLRHNDSRKCSRRRTEFRSRQRNTTAIFKNPGGGRLQGREAIHDGPI